MSGLVLADVVMRLTGLPFATVGGAQDYAGLAALPGRLPAAYVVPAGLRAQPNRLNGKIDQRVSREFAVVIIVAGRRAGAAAQADELQLLEDAVIKALLGWQPEGVSGPIELVSGQVLSVEGTAFTWALRCTAPYHIRTD